MIRSSRSLIFLAVGLYFFLYLPIAVVITSSLDPSRATTRGSGFTLDWYRSVLHNLEILSAVKNTLAVGCLSTLIATIIGSMLGYGLARHPFRGKAAVEKLTLLPVAVPDIVMAVSLLLFYSLLRERTGLFELDLGTMILSHVTFQIPFVALTVRARMRGFDPALEEAAYDLGASRWQRFWHVTLPILRPGILAGALLAFTLSLDDFVVSFFTSGPGSTTVPIYIYSAVKRGVTGEIHALSSLLILAAVLATAGLFVMQSRARKQ